MGRPRFNKLNLMLILPIVIDDLRITEAVFVGVFFNRVCKCTILKAGYPIATLALWLQFWEKPVTVSTAITKYFHTFMLQGNLRSHRILAILLIYPYSCGSTVPWFLFTAGSKKNRKKLLQHYILWTININFLSFLNGNIGTSTQCCSLCESHTGIITTTPSQ